MVVKQERKIMADPSMASGRASTKITNRGAKARKIMMPPSQNATMRLVHPVAAPRVTAPPLDVMGAALRNEPMMLVSPSAVIPRRMRCIFGDFQSASLKRWASARAPKPCKARNSPETKTGVMLSAWSDQAIWSGLGR